MIVTSIAFTIATIEHLRHRPHDVKRSSDQRAAYLLSGSGTVLHEWRGAQDGGTIRVAEFLSMPSKLGRGPLAVLGFKSSDDERYDRRLCVFDLSRSFEEPIWYSDVDPADVPPEVEPNVTQRIFRFAEGWLFDVFLEEESPGPEIVAVFANVFSRRLIRIYSLDGKILFETWHDGTVDDCHHDAKNRLLIFASEDGEKYCYEREGGSQRIRRNYPHVLFAIRLKSGVIENRLLRKGYGQGEYRSPSLAWYHCLSPLDRTDDIKKILLGPANSLDAVCCVVLEYGPLALDLSWDLAANGTPVPGSWVRNDDYHRAVARLELVPKDGDFQLGPLPPPTLAPTQSP